MIVDVNGRPMGAVVADAVPDVDDRRYLLDVAAAVTAVWLRAIGSAGGEAPDGVVWRWVQTCSPLEWTPAFCEQVFGGVISLQESAGVRAAVCRALRVPVHGIERDRATRAA